MILHVAELDKFIPPFMEFVDQNFDVKKHRYFIVGDMARHSYRTKSQAFHIEKGHLRQALGLIRLALEIQKADKVILHGLFNQWFVLLLFLMPWSLHKCHWLIWGGDLYRYQAVPRELTSRVEQAIRRVVISRLGYIVTSIDGDYQRAVSWYGAKGKRLEIFTYPNSCFCPDSMPPAPPKSGDELIILAGNSADSSNNHRDVFKKIEQANIEKKFKVYCPLSYGDQAYADEIEALGCKMFGDSFVPMRDYMSYYEYMELLASVDLALFAHNRQQALSNIRILLGLGKKVYMRTNLSSYSHLSDFGIKVFDVEQFEVEPYFEESESNVARVEAVFSFAALRKNLEILFGQEAI